MSILINDTLHGDLSHIFRRLLTNILTHSRQSNILKSAPKARKSLSPAQVALLKLRTRAAAPEFLCEKESVRVCKLHEYKAIALSLAHSFEDDPVALYFVNMRDTASWSAERKWALHITIMEAVVRWHLLDGMVTTIGDNYGCVALWMPPNAPADSLTTFIRSGLWKLHWQLSSEGRRRWFSYFMPTLHDVKHNVLKERDDDSWYLVYLGTRPEARRKGYARAVIEDVAERCDAEGRAMYLESSKPTNVPIYEKFGFDTRTRLDMPLEDGDVVPLEIMVREPQKRD
jgi:GNAT superfamily N-acetyltransferase